MALNRVPPRGGPGAAVEALLAEEGAELLGARVGNRIAFAKAFMEGRGVTEPPAASKAAEEIAALTDEIAGLLG